MKQQHISRAGRKAQILMNVFERTAGDTAPICTAYSIANGIGLKPSTHVRKLINELVDAGWLNQREQHDLWGRKSILHWLTTDAYEVVREQYAQGGNKLAKIKSWFEQ